MQTVNEYLQAYRDGARGITGDEASIEAYAQFCEEFGKIIGWALKAEILRIVSGVVPEMPEFMKYYKPERLKEIINGFEGCNGLGEKLIK